MSTLTVDVNEELTLNLNSSVVWVLQMVWCNGNPVLPTFVKVKAVETEITCSNTIKAISSQDWVCFISNWWTI